VKVILIADTEVSVSNPPFVREVNKIHLLANLSSYEIHHYQFYNLISEESRTQSPRSVMHENF
jgi:hypothetical protein